MLPPTADITRFLTDHWPVLTFALLGAVAVFLLLPRPRNYPFAMGLVLAVAGVAVGGTYLIERVGPLTVEAVLFYTFAGLAILGGGLLVTQRNPARAAISFALVVLSTCGLFLLQAAPFLMAVSVIIYAGAIIVTFLFVLMLSQPLGFSDADDRSREPLLATMAGFLLLATLLVVLQRTYDTRPQAPLRDLIARADRIAGADATSADDVRTALGEGLTAPPDDAAPEDDKDSPTGKANLYFRALDAAIKRVPTSDAEERSLSKLMDNLQDKVFDPEASPEDLKSALGTFAKSAPKVLADVGVLRPPEGVQFSELSGPPPNRPVARDERDGRPLVPAANVAALGRSLFSDYLLAVELAGTLLLVATIGAIAITARRPEPRA